MSRYRRLLIALVGTGVLSAGLGFVADAAPTPRARVRGAHEARRVTSATTASFWDGWNWYSVRVGSLLRQYLLYVPPGDGPRHRLPLVLLYHGATDTATNTVWETGLWKLDEARHNMILAFLQGYEDTWDADAGTAPAEVAHIDDIAFTKAVLRRIESNHYVDMRRVVASGFSNGAIFTEAPWLPGCSKFDFDGAGRGRDGTYLLEELPSAAADLRI